MCGIAGLIRLPSRDVDATLIDRMTELVAHRGPDGRGTMLLSLALAETPQDWRIALGHRRLSILDLSEAGRQPMRRGDLLITYNGEIYNYVELRDELRQLGQTFHTQTDTEVVLAAYEVWGTACFERFRGMWGLLLIDSKRRRAIVSRDRLGIKPLYLRRWHNLLAVVSEIKQLTAIPFASLSARTDAVGEYLGAGYEDLSRTFFEDVESLRPGTWMEISLDDLTAGAPQSYWHPERVQATVSDPEEAARAFASVLRESVRIHLRSDVPVGCALSGGLDSTSIAALVAELNHRGGGGAPFHTFTATFPGESADESRYVSAVLDEVHATPHFVTPAPEAMLEEIDRFVWIHDEPVGHISQYAGYCVARLTREAGVPVTLNGQGGDEVLGGYWQSYFVHLTSLARHHPLQLARHLAGVLMPFGNPELARQVPVMLRRYLHRRRSAQSARKKLDGIMSMSDAERRVYEIREMYLPRLLKWDDRNFMAFSVEGRYPFLDHQLIETALSFKPEALYRSGWTKEPLRRGLARVLPEKIRKRRIKLGFEAPQEKWLGGKMRPALTRWLEGDSPLWSYAERGQVRALADQAWQLGETRDEPGQALFRHFVADRWLRKFASA